MKCRPFVECTMGRVSAFSFNTIDFFSFSHSQKFSPQAASKSCILKDMWKSAYAAEIFSA